MKKLLGVVITAVALFGSGCSTDTTVNLGDQSDETAAVSQADGVPTTLSFLGDLVDSRGAPAMSNFDEAGGSVELDEGAMVVVANGAFAQTTEVTTQVLDLDFTATLGDSAPWSRAYVVSTVDDVALGAPVTIEIPRPADELRAVQIIDGELVAVEVLGDATSAHIEIPHFSDITTIVLNTWGPEAAEAARVEMVRLRETGWSPDSPATFLGTCIGVITALVSRDLPDLARDFALGACANALIQRSAPGGKTVSTHCVGDRISEGLDFQPAVDACAAESDGTEDEGGGDDGDDATAAEDTPAADEPEAEPLPPDTQLVWSGTLETDERNEPTLMTVTRIAGTDQFTIERESASVPETGNYREPGGLKRVECTVQFIGSDAGTGTFDDDASHLVFAGDGTAQTVYIAGPCEDKEPILGLNFRDLQLRIGPDGLEHDSLYDGVGTEILLGAPPRPVGQ